MAVDFHVKHHGKRNVKKVQVDNDQGRLNQKEIPTPKPSWEKLN